MLFVGEILGELSSSMAILNGRSEVGIGFDLARQLVAHDFDQIVAGQQVCRLAVGETLLGQEHQRHHHQRHVMVPRLPAPDLILRHATSSLGILEGPFHEMPCHLHVRQPTQARLGLSIGQAELQLRAVDLPPHQEIPAVRPFLGAIPQPHMLLQVIGNDFAFLPLTHRQSAPAGRRLGGGPGRHRQRQGLRLQAAGRLALGRLTLRHDGRRITEIDRLIRMHLREKSLPLGVQCAQQLRQMPVAGIEHDVSETQTLPPQAMDHGQRHLALGAEFRRFWNASLPAAGGIGEPRLGKIQFPIDQGGDSIPHHGGEDANLTVVGLAQATVPLAGDTGGHVALLGEGAFIDHQRAGVAEMHVGVGDQLSAHATAIPSRFAQHVVEPLIPAAGHGLGHLLHVAPMALEQAVQIETCGVFDRAGTTLKAGKIRDEVGIEVRERGSDQRGNAIRVFELTSYSSTPR